MAKMNTNNPKQLLLTIAGAMLLTCTAHSSLITIDPTASYLLRETTDVNVPSPAISLADHNLKAGDPVHLATIGSYLYMYDPPPGQNVELFGMFAVFSSSDTLLGPTESHRVPGAIPVPGLTAVTDLTWPNSIPTDIPEDFFISGTGLTLQIPDGAQYLFVTSGDSWGADAHAGPNGYQLSIAPVPDPATIIVDAVLLFPFGVGFARFLRKKA